jgi:DeoR family glycerol-3-phosphate regulon repressor
MVKIAEPHSTHREVELLETLRSLGGSSRTAALAEALGVSEETIRRTVKALAKSGLLQRVHGGVYLTNKDALSPFAARLGKHAEEKSRIATQAAAMIPNSSSVFLDVGSTTAFVAERLKDHRDLTVITNALTPAQALVGRNGNRVYLVGGELREVESGAFGISTVSYVSQFHIDTAVLSVDGIDASSGFLLAGAAEADLARAVVARAKRRIVVADHSKFGQPAPFVACPAESIDVLVTDKAPRQVFEKRLAEWEIELVVAGAKERK